MSQVAALSGEKAENTRRYLMGLSRIPTSFAARFCLGLGVSPEWLLVGEGEERLP